MHIPGWLRTELESVGTQVLKGKPGATPPRAYTACRAARSPRNPLNGHVRWVSHHCFGVPERRLPDEDVRLLVESLTPLLDRRAPKVEPVLL